METSLRHIFQPSEVTTNSPEKDSTSPEEALPKLSQCCLNLALLSDSNTREDEYFCFSNTSDDISSEMTSESITHDRKIGFMPKSKSGPNLGLLPAAEMSQLV